jgi:hypothetical protein
MKNTPLSMLIIGAVHSNVLYSSKMILSIPVGTRNKGSLPVSQCVTKNAAILCLTGTVLVLKEHERHCNAGQVLLKKYFAMVLLCSAVVSASFLTFS